MTRSQCRENAFLILFEASLRDDTPEELFRLAEEIGEIGINDTVRSLVTGVLSKTEALDDIIASYSKKRAVSRIARVNLILLRMAIYEISETDIPVNAAVSEAVNLAQRYASQEDSAFVNGVLGAYTRSLPPRAEASGDAE